MISRLLMEKVINGNRNERVYLCEQEFAAFAMYYFSDFFVYKSPEFHFDMYKDLQDIVKGVVTYLLWLMFRESAKTSIVKMFVVYCIVYRKKRFINWDSYDKDNAEAALFDISTWLQTNKKLIADFGQMYFEDSRNKGSQTAKSMKRINEFITTNKVKVKAYSTQESTRGRIFDRFRPDLFIVDDFETNKTKASAAITAKVGEHIDEFKTGMSVDGQVIFLCNFITENGSVAKLLNEVEENPSSWRLRRVDVVMDGKIMWPDKYVRTNDEAAEINKTISDRSRLKVSLHQKKKDLNAGGKKLYETEMLNNPEAAGEAFFNRERVEAAIASCTKKVFIKEIGGFKMWEEYIPKARYAIGGDTAKGVGRDSCASVAIRFSDLSTQPSRVVGTYANNLIGPDMFGNEMENQGNIFGGCLLAPELNNTGFATVTQLKANKYKKIYRQIVKDQVGKVIKDDLGWEATSANVAELYYQFRTAFDGGYIEVFCPRLLGEMKKFTNADLREASRKSESDSVSGTTRHFDLLRAAVIAWEMRTHARVVIPEKKYKQGAYHPTSEYQSDGSE